jgi:hypothetical protein
VTTPVLRERTVSFYEVVVAEDGEQYRSTQIDFPAMLNDLATAPIAARRWDTDQTFVGTVFGVDERDHLLLHRVKDPGEWLSVMDLTTGEWHELESAASQGYLETTAISFLPFGNVVGLMQGSTSSPSHKRLEGWLNNLSIFEDQLVVRALVAPADIDRLRTADGATRVEIRIGSNRSAALAGHTGRLASFLRRASEEYGDVRVTMTISIPPGGAREEDRHRLLEDLRDLADVMPDSADLAKARLLFSDVGGDEYARLAEFVEHHITAKRQVPAVDEEGNSIRLTAALDVIVGVSFEHEQELRLATESE